MQPLADKALAVVNDGTITFHPSRWANEYRRWLEDIRDWPISRQLWWGHRIPVWYPVGEDGERDEDAFVVSVDSPGPGYVQDEDVLDTWFSSWLWPFATLGWPEKTDALQAFYPGSVLVSGYDILFFWIARMIMAGTHFLDEVPYTDVFVTGMIKDKQGRWMSKSLGNGIDPLDMIEQYGADAVRYTLAVLCAQGQDIKLDEGKFEGGRNFANKVWNASRVFGRFVEKDEAGRPTEDLRRERDFADLDLAERWLLTRLHETTEAVTAALDTYRISEAAHLVYDFVWRDFCDWYLEVSKAPHGETPDRETLALSTEVFEQVVQLLHPFMPFVTEELWWTLRPRADGDALIAAAWPTPDPAETDAQAARTFATVQDLVTAVRQVRAQYNVPPSQDVRAVIVTGDAATAASLEGARGYVERLAGLGDLTLGTDLDKPAASAAVVVGAHVVYVPLEGMIDLDVERQRLQKEIGAKRGFLGGVEKKLQNQAFTSRAPEAVVDKERQKADDARAEIAALQANLADLGLAPPRLAPPRGAPPRLAPPRLAPPRGARGRGRLRPSGARGVRATKRARPYVPAVSPWFRHARPPVRRRPRPARGLPRPGRRRARAGRAPHRPRDGGGARRRALARPRGGSGPLGRRRPRRLHHDAPAAVLLPVAGLHRPVRGVRPRRRHRVGGARRRRGRRRPGGDGRGAVRPDRRRLRPGRRGGRGRVRRPVGLPGQHRHRLQQHDGRRGDRLQRLRPPRGGPLAGRARSASAPRRADRAGTPPLGRDRSGLRDSIEAAAPAPRLGTRPAAPSGSAPRPFFNLP